MFSIHSFSLDWLHATFINIRVMPCGNTFTESCKDCALFDSYFYIQIDFYINYQVMFKCLIPLHVLIKYNIHFFLFQAVYGQFLLLYNCKTADTPFWITSINQSIIFMTSPVCKLCRTSLQWSWSIAFGIFLKIRRVKDKLLICLVKITSLEFWTLILPHFQQWSKASAAERRTMVQRLREMCGKGQWGGRDRERTLADPKEVGKGYNSTLFLIWY